MMFALYLLAGTAVFAIAVHYDRFSSSDNYKYASLWVILGVLTWPLIVMAYAGHLVVSGLDKLVVPVIKKLERTKRKGDETPKAEGWATYIGTAFLIGVCAHFWLSANYIKVGTYPNGMVHFEGYFCTSQEFGVGESITICEKVKGK